jgi:hypothetical protein
VRPSCEREGLFMCKRRLVVEGKILPQKKFWQKFLNIAGSMPKKILPGQKMPRW